MYDYDTLAERFREMAFLNKGLHIQLTDEREREEDGSLRPNRSSMPAVSSTSSRGSIVAKETLNTPIYFLRLKAPRARWKLLCSGQRATALTVCFAFANNINTHEGGTHLDGFKNALTRTINEYARAHAILKEKTATFPATTPVRVWRLS